MATAVESQTIDNSAVFRQPEYPGFWVSRLRFGRDGAQLGVTKTHAQQSVGNLTVLVETCGHAQRIGEGKASNVHRKTRVSTMVKAGKETQLKSADGKGMSLFGIQRKQQFTTEGVIDVDHASSNGITCAPSLPSGMGRTQTTASIVRPA